MHDYKLRNSLNFFSFWEFVYKLKTWTKTKTRKKFRGQEVREKKELRKKKNKESQKEDEKKGVCSLFVKAEEE